MADSNLSLIRAGLELLYFISGIVLAGGLVLAHFQLKAVKRDSYLRVKRTAVEKAIDACDRYITTCIPMYNKFYDICASKNLAGYDGPVANFTYASVPEKYRSNSKLRFSEVAWLDCFNQMELVAAALVAGVGDEAIAYPVIGRSFCFTVRANYDLLAFCRKDPDADEYYPNIVHLFSIWEPRRVRSKMSREKNRIESTIDRLPNSSISTLEDRI